MFEQSESARIRSGSEKRIRKLSFAQKIRWPHRRYPTECNLEIHYFELYPINTGRDRISRFHLGLHFEVRLKDSALHSLRSRRWPIQFDRNCRICSVLLNKKCMHFRIPRPAINSQSKYAGILRLLEVSIWTSPLSLASRRIKLHLRICNQVEVNVFSKILVLYNKKVKF